MLVVLDLGRQIGDSIQLLELLAPFDLLLNLKQNGYLILSDLNAVKVRLIDLFEPHVTLDVLNFVPVGWVDDQKTLNHVFARLVYVAGY